MTRKEMVERREKGEGGIVNGMKEGRRGVTTRPKPAIQPIPGQYIALSSQHHKTSTPAKREEGTRLTS
jgi:hypothetical protein